MAIYKLKDVCDLRKGKGKFYKRHLDKKSGINAYHYGQLYKTNLLTEWETTVNKEFSRDDNYVNVDEIMVIDVSESFDEIGHVVYNSFERGLIGNHIIHLHNFRGVLPKWLFYYLQNNQILFKQLAYGDKVASLKVADIEHLEIINLPSLKEQQEIIDIIKPIEKQLKTLEKIKNKLYFIVDNFPVESTKTYIDFESIKTGQKNANHENKTGKYNFYTCGEKIRKCSEYSFDGKFILLSGNASLYTWWYEGKFELYQRVYALNPKENFFTAYHAVRLGMQKLRDESSGSVIKYIKLGDIQRIEQLNSNYEKELKQLYTQISNCEANIELLSKQKNEMIKLLIK